MRFLRVARALIVVGVVIALVYATASAVLSGAPVLADPLTTHGAFEVGPGNFSVLSGAITGEDYVEGNYTVMNPPGGLIGFVVYNTSEFAAFHVGASVANQSWVGPSSAGRIVFDAPYTDTFYLVFESPYPATSSLQLLVYVETNYESNVDVG